jgi:hypothetical protein
LRLAPIPSSSDQVEQRRPATTSPGMMARTVQRLDLLLWAVAAVRAIPQLITVKTAGRAVVVQLLAVPDCSPVRPMAASDLMAAQHSTETPSTVGVAVAQAQQARRGRHPKPVTEAPEGPARLPERLSHMRAVVEAAATVLALRVSVDQVAEEMEATQLRLDNREQMASAAAAVAAVRALHTH